MTNKTGIEWADVTLNPYTGCHKYSAGCRNCYAKEQHNLLRDNFKLEKYNHPFFERRFHEEELEKFARKKKPQLVFVGSMSDWLHEDHMKHAERMSRFCYDNPQHFYLFLTKRAERIKDVIHHFLDMGLEDHVGFGVTIESSDYHDRARHLRALKWRGLKFVSCEPLLDAIDLKLGHKAPRPDGIHWVIAGCESGPERRPCAWWYVHVLWAKCYSRGVPFMFKQMQIDGKVVKAPTYEGQQWLQYPQQIKDWRERKL